MYLCFYDQPIIEYIHCHLVSYAVCMFTLVMASLGSLLFRTTCVIAPSIKEIKQGKVKIDEDSVKATVDDAEIVKIKSAFHKLGGIFEVVKMDLTIADKD